MTEELRLGSADDPDLGFSGIGPVAVSDEGSVYVLDRQSREIRVFAPDGRRLNMFGGAGEGPGEFAAPQGPQGMGFRGDTLWVNDPGLARITLFDTGGNVLSTFPSVRSAQFDGPAPGVLAGARGAVLRADGFVHLEEPYGVVFLRAGAAPPDSIDIPVLRYDRRGEVVDTVDYMTVYLIPSGDEGRPEVAMPGGLVVSRPAQTEMVVDPGPPADLPLRLRFDAGKIVIDRRAATGPSVAASFTVTHTTVEGDTIYSRRFVYNPRPFSDAMKASLRRDGLRVPSVQPPVSGAYVGPDGTLWLRREHGDGMEARWMVLDPNGSPIGSVRMDASAVPRWVGGNIAFVVLQDQFGVPWLVRYHLLPFEPR